MKNKKDDIPKNEDGGIDFEAWCIQNEEQVANYNKFEYLMNCTTFGDYRTGHTLTHPWVLIPFVGYHLKWAWQRVFNGYDDRVIFSIDYYLVDMLPIWMEELIKSKPGVPGAIFKEGDFDETGYVTEEIHEIRAKEFNMVMQEIADGFREYKKILDWEVGYKSPEEKEVEQKFQRALYLLGKYFGCFWC